MNNKTDLIDCAIIMSPYADPYQIKAAFDAAINLHIFDQTWAMYITATQPNSNTQSHCDILAQRYRELLDYCGETSLYWVTLDNNNTLPKPAELTHLFSISSHIFRQHLRKLRCVINF